MFYTGLDPQTMEPVYVPKSAQEKFYQRTLLQYYKPENRRAVIEALIHSPPRGPDRLRTGLSGRAGQRIHPHPPAQASSAQNGGKSRWPADKQRPVPRHRPTGPRRGSVVTRDGVLTNDTRSPRQKRR